MRAAVVVLGDLGRSPRMLFHARALAAEGIDVDLIGSSGSALPCFITGDRRIVVHTISDRRPSESRAPFLVGAAFRGVVRVAPTVAGSRLRSARFAIDWHNPTSAMLALRLGARHPVVRWAARFEAMMGRAADVNLFVSSHMQDLLHAQLGVTGTVFRDRPADVFAPLSTEDRKRVRDSLFGRMCEQSGRERVLLVSPTSWTADENLGMFVDALEIYNLSAERGSDTNELPPIVAMITGRGPQRHAFEQRVARNRLPWVDIRTAWLDADEYPRVLAAADLGMCFHTSASGMDLPMKITDMFGAGIPVCAYDYGACLRELVRPGVNGVLFRTADECRLRLETLLRGFPRPNSALQHLNEGVRRSAESTWAEGWTVDARRALIAGRSERTSG